MQQKLVDVAIIGGGPAGYTAALYLCRAGLKVMVLEKLSVGGQVATTGLIDNYPGFDEGIDGLLLSDKMKKGAERFGAETVFADVVKAELTLTPKKLTLADGSIITAQAVVLATGASPRLLGVKGEDEFRGRGVSYCATCDGMFFRGKTVAVVGGGNSAAADALILSKLAAKVYLIHRRDSLRASLVYANALKEAKNVEFVWNSSIEEILYGDFLTGVRVKNLLDNSVRDVACNGVFVAIGRMPDTALFAEQITLDKHGYVISDESTKTNLAGVFAAGDLRVKPLRQIVTATADGAAASHAIEEYFASQKK